MFASVPVLDTSPLTWERALALRHVEVEAGGFVGIASSFEDGLSLRRDPFFPSPKTTPSGLVTVRWRETGRHCAAVAGVIGVDADTLRLGPFQIARRFGPVLAMPWRTLHLRTCNGHRASAVFPIASADEATVSVVVDDHMAAGKTWEAEVRGPSGARIITARTGLTTRIADGAPERALLLRWR